MSPVQLALHGGREHWGVLGLRGVGVQCLGLLAVLLALGHGFLADLQDVLAELGDLGVLHLVELVDVETDGDPDVVVEHFLLLVA